MHSEHSHILTLVILKNRLFNGSISSSFCRWGTRHRAAIYFGPSHPASEETIYPQAGSGGDASYYVQPPLQVLKLRNDIKTGILFLK